MTGSKWIAAMLLSPRWGSACFAPEGIGRTAFAWTIPGVDDPMTLTWTTTYYCEARASTASGPGSSPASG